MKFQEKYSDKSYIRHSDSRRTIVLKELQSSYIGKNKSGQKLTVYQVDEGMIQGNATYKCDYAIYTHTSDNIYFIELKGRNLRHACEQVMKTIEQLLETPKVQAGKVFVRIVVSQVDKPNISSTQVIKLKRKLKQLNRGQSVSALEYCSQKMIDIII